jgi:hypothetical protein
MLDFLITILSIVCYLAVGTFYARASAQRCYEASAKRWPGQPDMVTRSYWERLTVHVLGWPVVWPAQLVAGVVNAPVGDLETAYQMWKLTQDQMSLGRKELE